MIRCRLNVIVRQTYLSGAQKQRMMTFFPIWKANAAQSKVADSHLKPTFVVLLPVRF